ncbi:MAG: maleylacetate reductase [Alphaproteobacteria bacterium]|nr:maleylacetate reductase [Alphaproteobacteria bacterium]
MPPVPPDVNRQRVRFGTGIRREISAEVARLGKNHALVITTPGKSRLAREFAEYLGSKTAGTCSRAIMHTPVSVTGEALEYTRSVNADCLVAAGGGSAIGLAKAVALHTGLPQIAVPTTYAGSEATASLGQTENGVKTTLKDSRILPRTILYDSELVATLPGPMSATSGMNAMAHAVEGLYARDRSPETTELALRGLRAFAEGLPAVLETPRDLAARENTQRGAWACGAVLGRVGMALHHKLCHALGGAFDMPHAQTHAVILPHAAAYNEAEPEVAGLLAPVAGLFGAKTAGGALHDFARSLGAPLSLRELGLGEDDLPRAADVASRNPYWNPRPVTRDGILALLEDAWEGRQPRN